MSSFRVLVRDFPSLATRESGAAARELVLRQLRQFSLVVVDFTDAHPTPSFADELLGRLVETLGEAAFRNSVRVQGAEAETLPLLQQVISRRLHRRSGGPARSALEVA